jgi:3-dehydroquinate synthase
MKLTISDTPVFVGKNIISNISLFLKQKSYSDSKYIILADENTHKFCLPKLITESEVLKDAEVIEIESGELSKNIEICTGIWQTLLETGADRNSVIINLGGGVICDMGGFIASVFKRGIRFINIPTTLMAMVDAGIGGKTGIDIGEVKNQIGSFSNPDAVFIETEFLNTLPKREILSGFAEIIKYALIYDGSLWKKLNNFDPNDISLIEKLIFRCVEIKSQIVEADPYEKNIRQILNFGHNFGHAIETFSLKTSKKPISHGEAVAHGIIMESFISYKLKKLSIKELDEICSFVINFYKPIKFSNGDIENIIETLRFDKKNKNGEFHFSLITKIGTACHDVTVELSLVNEAFEFYLSKVKP